METYIGILCMLYLFFIWSFFIVLWISCLQRKFMCVVALVAKQNLVIIVDSLKL
jgi:hypothetical protein